MEGLPTGSPRGWRSGRGPAYTRVRTGPRSRPQHEGGTPYAVVLLPGRKNDLRNTLQVLFHQSRKVFELLQQGNEAPLDLEVAIQRPRCWMVAMWKQDMLLCQCISKEEFQVCPKGRDVRIRRGHFIFSRFFFAVPTFTIVILLLLLLLIIIIVRARYNDEDSRS